MHVIRPEAAACTESSLAAATATRLIFATLAAAPPLVGLRHDIEVSRAGFPAHTHESDGARCVRRSAIA